MWGNGANFTTFIFHKENIFKIVTRAFTEVNDTAGGTDEEKKRS